MDVSFVEAEALSVLVADDAGLWRRFVREAVLAYGGTTTVHEAATGLQALDCLSNNRVDVAFVDLAMPEINGAEVVERLHGARRMPFFAVISVTSDAEQIARMRRLAAYDYLVKPFDTEAVRRVLATHERVTQTTRVLLVDDSGTTLSIIRRLLDRSIFRLDIAEARDGVSAFELYARRTADIVFIDLNMPGLDGAQTLRIFRAYNPHVHVVLMSASQDALDQARELGANAYLKKPFLPRDIDLVMHRMFGLTLPYHDLAP
ncbi:response regulator [Labrys wisconsinensis]|uniref:CheY-like chemotaxis protein n=1 Tax=Labrys wisconsinensis TaxID=425677 RepID=A0ABU0J4X3_9HYPH|nr:response regulator [Labrys wisconsinensis]MDQ0469315.1 CheY-like chemotaxis protein [Labrys wisconsinensis]